MEKNIFKLDNEQLKGIAYAFREKVEEGLSKKMQRYNVFLPLFCPRRPMSKGRP